MSWNGDVCPSSGEVLMSALKVVMESCLRFGFKDALITTLP